MPDVAKEQADLEKADRDIREGEARVAQQMRLIDELRRDGHDVADAEKLLRTLEEALDTWKAHRDTIRSMLAVAQERAAGRNRQ